jgi:GrpB-like predicted nucleotidyltransferase (UPF0157 family)
MPSLYTFTEHDPAWAAAFQRESEQLRALLGDELCAIHHVGSTSVPGLAAKPIIDVLPLVRRLSYLDERTPALEGAGYRARGEYGLPGRRYFTKDHEGHRTHNVHAYQVDDASVERHLAFCAFLRRHEQVCREYEALKREVYARHPDDIGAYNDGKDAWIKRVEPLAIAWYRGRAG